MKDVADMTSREVYDESRRITKQISDALPIDSLCKAIMGKATKAESVNIDKAWDDAHDNLSDRDKAIMQREYELTKAGKRKIAGEWRGGIHVTKIEVID